MKPNIVISIDSLIASSYEHIRQNANFEKVWENVSYFRSFTNTYEKDLSFAVCPMTLNWQEVPDILQYCNENNIGLYLNTVTHPKKYSLYDLNPTSLKEVLDVVQATVFLDSTPIQKVNNLAYKSFVASLASTYKEIVSSYDLTMANFKSLSNNTSDELSQLLITYNAALYEQKTYESDNSSVDNHQLSTLYCQLKKTPDIIVKSYGHLLLDFLDAFGKSTDHTKRLEENLDGLLAFLLADQNIDYFERLMLIDLNDVLRLLTRTESKVFKERLYQNNYVEQWLNSRN
jgi:hypothetical protein